MVIEFPEKSFRFIFLSSVGVFFLWSLLACQPQEQRSSIEIESAFIEVLKPGQISAPMYMAIKNRTEKTQYLNYIHSPLAESIQVHRSVYVNGEKKSRRVKKLAVAPGERKVLAPGGFHLMISGIYDTLEVGDSFTVSFEFESGERLDSLVVVRP